ncbi:MAG: hypothetical protein MUE69_31825 [Myxococcota bacterium]|nr:hypothetical protein [Myxococcota bacterium]
MSTSFWKTIACTGRGGVRHCCSRWLFGVAKNPARATSRRICCSAMRTAVWVCATRCCSWKCRAEALLT